MSCETLDQQSTRLSVSAGALPEGFCPESMQDLFNAMAARLIVTPSANFAGITMGSIEPSGNVGLWLKDCEELFVFDDATARYVPITKGGFNTMEYKTVSGSFVVPPFIYRLKTHVWGAGGGGQLVNGGNSGAGGGGGGYAVAILNVIPGQTINFTVGLGGATGNPAVDGGNTTFLTLTGNGGKGATTLTTPGLGGTSSGGTFFINGGAGGGQGGAAVGGGSGGAAGQGGLGGNTDQGTGGGSAPGGGGQGASFASAKAAGAGADGGILVEY